jgi:hypothetical protein
MQYVDPIVAQVSPNLYSAAKQANLGTQQITQVEQMSYTIKKHRELAKLSSQAARVQFDKLDPNAQEQLKFMFKNADYLKEEPTAGDRVKGVFTTALKVAASPLIGLFKLGGEYNKVINEPYKVARLAAQGEDIFSTKTWKKAWDGNDVYDSGALSEVTQAFSKYDVEVAKGLLAGRTPGEIVQDYGKVDSNILESIKKAFNDPDNFKQVLDGVKYAQVSPGRDLARMLDTKPPRDGGLHGAYVSGTTKNVSGVVDFMYQLAIDPLTWLTGGSNKILTKGEKIANQILKDIDSGVGAERAVEKAFQDPKLYNLWENQLGPLVKRYKEGNAEEKAIAYRTIAENHPGWANPTFIKALAENEVPVVNAVTAKKYFEDATNLQRMISGRVDGMTYMRNGVAVARTNRLYMDGMARSLDNVFNFRRSAEELTPKVDEIHKALLNPEQAVARLKSPEGDMAVVLEASKEIKKWKKVGHLASRSAAGLEVRLGADAILTAGNFTARARQVLPRDMAEALTQRFLVSSADEQVVILRNLDAATMYSMGLGGDTRGTELIEKVLREKYGDKAGFATKVDVGVNAEHAAVAPKNAIKVENGVVKMNTEGPIQPYQSTQAIGSLPYDEIGSMVWNIRSKKNVINAIGGATQGAFSKKLVDSWSILTLFPRLGIRSAIDEATMYILSAPLKDLSAFARRQGNKMGNISKTFTGSAAGTGPIKKGIQKLFRIAPEINIFDVVGKKLNINPEEALSLEAREAAMVAYAKNKGIDVGLLDSLQKREAVSQHVAKIYAGYLDEKTMGYLLEAFVHSPDALNSMAQSLVAHSALSGKYGQEVMAAIVTPSMLDRAFEQLGVKMSRSTRVLRTANMSQREVTLAQYEKWFKSFVGNKAQLGDRTYLNPAKVFFENAGLRTGEDMTNALDSAMISVGFIKDGLTDGWKINDADTVKDFLSMSSHTVEMRSSGLADDEIVRTQLFRMFNDMYETFHGSVDRYNEKLMALMSKSKAEMDGFAIAAKKDGTARATWNQASAKISLDDFEEATDGYRLTGDINTAIDFDDFDAETVFRKYGNKAMEAMDAQVTGIFRQPAIMITYAQLRKKYAGLEREFAEQQYRKLGGLWEKAGVAKNDGSWKIAQQLAQKRFTEIATREAADTVLKYADNPTIRSNFAFSARTVGRYYRATEDFYRRIYRMKDVSPRVLYRMRLVNIGLDASGMIHKDQNGEPYVVMPMDNIIFKATDGTIRALTGNSGYSQPAFSEFTLKLRMMNPSFSQDAGLPTLSGPVAGLGVVGMMNILGTVPGKIPFLGDTLDAPSKELAQGIDTFALGNIGDNITIARATIPIGLQRMWAIINTDEKNRQEVTAAQQAMAYNAAHGLFLDANSTSEEKASYLKNVRISAHNILVVRNFLGLVAPVAPSMMETKGVPDYIKDTGLTSLRSEFFDILNGISAANKGEVKDPYEEALATFTGKYPGKLIYTVSRDDKQTKVLIKNTDQLKSWGIKNQSMIKQYGEAAYIFAPQTGDFNASTYNYIQAAGLVKSKSLEKYYDDLLVAEDKQRYYDIARLEKEQLSSMSDPVARANTIAAATRARDALKAANPLLTPALIGQGNNIGSEQVMMENVEQIISSPNTNVDPDTRKRMYLAIKMMRDYIAFCTNPQLQNVSNATDIKAERKLQIEADLRELMLGNMYLNEANRAIFKSILNFYSRDSYYAYKEKK